ncbi:MAG: response regulator [Chloroflexi bacterium]|nr:response regulator [Chloroflexota bacterium]MDA1174676.1 response regulator [Chloroflexota bacterium]
MSISVLVADDERLILSMVSAMLQRDGRFEIATASNGQEAIDACEASPPELLLLNGMMPGLDGFAVCQMLKSSPRTSGITIIMMSALTQKSFVEKGLAAGADHYLPKPFTRPTLIGAIDALLPQLSLLAK